MFFNKNPTRKSEYIELWNACKTNLFPGQTFVLYIYKFPQEQGENKNKRRLVYLKNELSFCSIIFPASRKNTESCLPISYKNNTNNNIYEHCPFISFKTLHNSPSFYTSI
jgi:hypothetical protein